MYKGSLIRWEKCKVLNLTDVALKGSAMSFYGKGSRVQTEHAFALALMHYEPRRLLYIGFSLKKFAGPQENP